MLSVIEVYVRAESWFRIGFVYNRLYLFFRLLLVCSRALFHRRPLELVREQVVVEGEK